MPNLDEYTQPQALFSLNGWSRICSEMTAYDKLTKISPPYLNVVSIVTIDRQHIKSCHGPICLHKFL